MVARNRVKNATENPDDYEGNINAMNTAKTIAIIILIINLLYFIYTIYIIFYSGYDEFLEKWNQAMEEVKRNT